MCRKRARWSLSLVRWKAAGLRRRRMTFIPSSPGAFVPGSAMSRPGTTSISHEARSPRYGRADRRLGRGRSMARCGGDGVWERGSRAFRPDHHDFRSRRMRERRRAAVLSLRSGRPAPRFGISRANHRSGRKRMAGSWTHYAADYAGGPGLVDQLSFVVMRRLRICHAFTNDRHFAAAGFDVLF